MFFSYFYCFYIVFNRFSSLTCVFIVFCSFLLFSLFFHTQSDVLINASMGFPQKMSLYPEPGAVQMFCYTKSREPGAVRARGVAALSSPSVSRVLLK